MKAIKAYTNILKLSVNMTMRRTVVKNYPLIAYIEPTSYCNLRCPACPTGLRLGLRSAATLKLDLFTSMIDEIGDYLFLLYMYNWGEPLLHKQTPELIAYAKQKDIRVVSSSNLSVKLTDDYIERLVRSGLDNLIVSLDGATEETYQKYRRRGKHALVIENMSRIQAMKKTLNLTTPTITCQFLVARHNEHEMDMMRAKYKEWGADQLAFGAMQMPFEPYNDGFEPSTIPLYNLSDPTHLSHISGKRQLQSKRPCSWLYGTVVMNPNGKVSPCCGVADEKYDFGEYSPSQGFFDVWNSEKYKQARTLFSQAWTPFWKKAPSKEPEIFDIKGMGTNIERKPDELICQKCPIPYHQYDAVKMIFQIAGDHIMHFKSKKDMRYFMPLLLLSASMLMNLHDPNILHGMVRWIRKRGLNWMPVFGKLSPQE